MSQNFLHYTPENDVPKELVLIKKTHRWVFRYRSGEEATVLRVLASTARDTEQDFDWFDAAVLSHQMGDKLHQQLKDIMSGDKT